MRWGRTGQIQPGDVIKFGMPLRDLHVVLNGVEIKSGLALGSWTAFKRDGTGAMIMGDLVLTEDEVEPVMMKLQDAKSFQLLAEYAERRPGWEGR